MYNFAMNISTKIYFGKGQIEHLKELANYGKKVLIAYGGGSVKRSGLFDKAVALIKDAGVEIVELPGVEPNPRIETVRKGAELCKSEGIDMVLALGGGSTIDCSKVVAAAAKYDGDAWDLVMNPGLIADALPVFTVLTLSATGSEMDPFAVISDLNLNVKAGTSSDLIRPTFSILDPENTYTVPKRQTASGTADIMSHTLEGYFTNEPAVDLVKNFSEGLLRTIIKYGPIALEEPDNYDARANLMLAGSHAINGICSSGAQQAWTIHPLEHELSAYYDITHGEGLAILTPVWMEYILNEKTAPFFARYGKEVFGIEGEDEIEVSKKAIEATKDFLYNKMGVPSTLRAVGITTQDKFEEMAGNLEGKMDGCFVPLSKEDMVEIYKRCF